MELFKITCVTCQAGLSVRNESLIGQIVACPRCGSMVEVSAPTQAVAPVTTGKESLAESAPDQVATSNVSTAEVSTPASASATASESFENMDEASLAGEASAPAASLPTESLPVEANAEALQVSAAVAKYKLIVWSLASVCIATTVIGVVLLTRGNTGAEATQAVPNAIQPSANQLPTTSKSVPENLPARDEPMPQAETLATDNADAPPSIEAPDKIEAPLSIEDNVVSAMPPDPPTESNISQEIVSVGSPETPQEPAPRMARRFDPLEFDPESISLATVDQPQDVLDEQLEPERIEPPAEAEAAALDDVPSTAPLVRRGPNIDSDASQRDAAKQLELLVPAVKFSKLPLHDCLRFFTQLSGVPVSVSPEQLLMAGITPQQHASLDAKELSLGEMLTQVLEPLRLEYETRGGQVIVVRQEATKIREITYPINDLVSSSGNEEQLASLVEQFVAPQTWQMAGGDGAMKVASGSLQVKQTQQVQYQVLILLERLRLARNLPPRSRYPVERLVGSPAGMLLEEALAKPTTFTFSQYTAIDDVFVHWQTELDVPLLIDWPALAKADFGPSSAITCAIIDEPWNLALEKVLEPLGLGWRAVAGNAIEITSAKKVQDELQLEIYPLVPTKAFSIADLLQKLNTLAKPPLTEGSMTADPTGQALLVLQPAATQRLVWQRLRKLQLTDDN